MAAAPPVEVPIIDETQGSVVGMALADFLRIPLERFELIDGEVIPKMPHLPRHDFVGDLVRDAMREAIDGKGVGLVVREWTFISPDADRKNWVKGSYVPAIMFIRQDRLDAYIQEHPNWLDEPLALIPDLVIEIVSPTDRNSDVLDKVQRYLRDGVPLVWIVDMERRRIYQYRAEGDPVTVLTDADLLDGGDLIPGFSLAVAAVFV
jgi:Uma2 family endonuclease